MCIIYKKLGGERKTDKETDGKVGVEPASACFCSSPAEIVEWLLQQDQHEPPQWAPKPYALI
jgi:hypothetical protein